MRQNSFDARRASILGLGPVDAVLILDEDIAMPAAPSTTAATTPSAATTTPPDSYSRAALSTALKSLLALPLLARGGGGRRRVVTVVRFVTDGTVEEALEERGAGRSIGSLEVCVYVCVLCACGTESESSTSDLPLHKSVHGDTNYSVVGTLKYPPFPPHLPLGFNAPLA